MSNFQESSGKPKIAVASTVRTNREQLLAFVHYHLNCGIDHVYVYFDTAGDPLRETLQDIAGASAIDCDDSYWQLSGTKRPEAVEHRQIENVNHCARVAEQDDIQWLVHIDIDELIYPHRCIHSALAATTADALCFGLLEAVPEEINYKSIFEPNLFKRKTGRIPLWIARAIGCGGAFFNGEYFRAHKSSKMAVRLGRKVIKHGIHKPRETVEGYRIETTADVDLLHFDCIGVADWSAKWQRRLDGSGKAINMRAVRSQQLTDYAEAQAAGTKALNQLYADTYFLPDRNHSRLRLLGLLQTIDINPTCFLPQQELASPDADESN